MVVIKYVIQKCICNLTLSYTKKFIYGQNRSCFFLYNKKRSAWKGTPFAQTAEESKHFPVLERMDRHFICPKARKSYLSLSKQYFLRNLSISKIPPSASLDKQCAASSEIVTDTSFLLLQLSTAFADLVFFILCVPPIQFLYPPVEARIVTT